MKTDLTFTTDAEASENGLINMEAQQPKSNDTSLQSILSAPFPSPKSKSKSKADRVSNRTQCRIQRRARVPVSER